jgi:plastocyanin
MKYRVLLASALALSVVGGCWAAGVIVVNQKGLAFSVETLTVAKGAVVQFTNSDTTPHNILITQGDETIDGGLQQPGTTYKVPFLKAGTYDIICAIHPKMHMSVKVE